MRRNLVLLIVVAMLSFLCFNCAPDTVAETDPQIKTTGPRLNTTAKSLLKRTDTRVQESETPRVLTSPITTQKPSLTSSPIPTVTRVIAPGSGETRVSPFTGMIMVYVPEGSFPMGSTSQDPGADPDEFPQHTVYLDAYWIGQSEVTNAMFSVFLNEKGDQVETRYPWLDASAKDVLIAQTQRGEWQPRPGYSDYPVVEITWFGALAYCQWAGGHLPTEAEWEKAARGVDGRIFPWGDYFDCNNAQLVECTGAQLHPTRSLLDGASPYNALDMAGSVWEWVADWYSPNYYQDSPQENPGGPDSGTARVVRGGSWAFDAKHARATNRRNDGPLVTKPDYGFRCVFNSGTN